MFTKDDVGNKVVNGKTVVLSDAEKQAIADEWNANQPTIDDKRNSMSCTPWQMVQALNDMNMLESVEAYIETAPVLIKQGWNKAPSYHRTSEWITQAITGLGLTDEQADQIFTLAMSK